MMACFWQTYFYGEIQRVCCQFEVEVCSSHRSSMLCDRGGLLPPILQESIPPIVSFHMGSLGFMAPFQFTKTVGHSEKSIYKDYLDKALKGYSIRQC